MLDVIDFFEKCAQSSAGGIAGVIQQYAGINAPDGWLLCDGSEVLIEDYPKLFTVIGNTYGTPSAATKFVLPDLRGRVPVGVGDGTATGHTNHTLGQKAGNENAITPYHRHSVSAVSISSSGTHSHELTGYGATLGSGSTGWRFGSGGSKSASGIISGDGGHTHSVPAHNTNYEGTSGNATGANMQPYIALNYIISTGEGSRGGGGTKSVWETLATTSVSFTKSSGDSDLTVNSVFANSSWLIINLLVRTTAAVSTATNVWVGTLTTPFTILEAIKDTAFSSGSVTIFALSSDGTCNVRNSGASSLSSGANNTFTLRIPIIGF